MSVLDRVDDGGEAGEWLVGFRRRADAGEAQWLDVLARFDLDRGWEDEGQLSCVDWLMWRVGLGRATAFDRLRVAHELRRRPVLAAALGEGRVSYCAVRAMCRAEGTSVEVDEALVGVASSGTVADVERVVRSYRLYRSQESGPGEERPPARGVRIRACGDGMAKVEAVVTETEAAELKALLSAVIEGRPEPSAAPVDESSREDERAPAGDVRGWAELQVDALMDVVRSGLGVWASGADRYMVHLVVRDGECAALGGEPVAPGEAERVRCDCSHVTHVEDGVGVPLALGRRQRVWSAAQRRAVLVRDGGRCRWPGCERSRVDIHHVLPWEDGGTTDVSNGVAMCPQHHAHLHDGWYVTGGADSTLTFHTRAGRRVGRSTVLGASVPSGCVRC